MKVSDPIIFGHAVRAFFADVFAEHGAALDAAGVNPNNGLAALLAAIADAARRRAGRDRGRHRRRPATAGPGLAMVDSDRGITNLHVPSDVIVDASMPAMIRTSGQMWNAAGEQQDTKAVIPDSSYAGDLPGRHRRLPGPRRLRPRHDGLGAQRRAHGPEGRGVRLPRQDLRDRRGRHRPGGRRAPATVLLEHAVEAGDIWRMCQTKDAAIQDWVKLAVTRARATGAPGRLLARRRPGPTTPSSSPRSSATSPTTTPTASTSRSWPPVEATGFSLERIRQGEDTISVTGNVLRDYLTDLFPILELGTSAKMLSIVPLMNGGGLFETGAGGSAPKHVQQFVKENHLRWDSLGEFLALAASFEHLASSTGNPRAQVLADTLDAGHRQAARRGQVAVAQGRRDRQPGQPLLPGPLLGRGAGRPDRPTPSWPPRSRRWPSAWLADEEHASSTSCSACRASPVDIGGYYAPDPDGRHGHAPQPHLQRRPRHAGLTPGCSPTPSSPSTRRRRRPTRSTRTTVARRFGFRGGLVPGVDVYAYLCHPPVGGVGAGLARAGTMRARFRQPVYDGDTVDDHAGDGDGALELRDRGGRVCATATRRRCPTTRRRCPTPPTGRTSRRPPTRRPPRPRCSCRAPRSGSRRTASTPTGPASTSPTSARPHRSTRPSASPIPAGSCATRTTCCPPTSALGPWIHVESVVQHHGVVEDGEEVVGPGPRHGGVGAQGPPLRGPRRAPPRRRRAGRPDRPHRHLPAPRGLNRAGLRRRCAGARRAGRRPCGRTRPPARSRSGSRIRYTK